MLLTGPAVLPGSTMTEHSGFMQMVDQGVPWYEDLHTVGAQYDFVKVRPGWTMIHPDTGPPMPTWRR